MTFKLIEQDTDGVFIHNDGNSYPPNLLNDLNVFIKKEVSQWGSSPEMIMEEQLWPIGYWYKAKNYLLRDKNNKIKTVGSAFKGAGRARFTDEFRDEMTHLILDDKPKKEIINCIKRHMRIEKLPLHKLTKRVTITKYPSQYVNNHIGKKLALMAQDQLNIDPTPYTQFEYVEGVKGPMLAARHDPKKLDYIKYRQMIADVAKCFGYYDDAIKFVKSPGFTEMEQVIW